MDMNVHPLVMSLKRHMIGVTLHNKRRLPSCKRIILGSKIDLFCCSNLDEHKDEEKLCYAKFHFMLRNCIICKEAIF